MLYVASVVFGCIALIFTEVVGEEIAGGVTKSRKIAGRVVSGSLLALALSCAWAA